MIFIGHNGSRNPRTYLHTINRLIHLKPNKIMKKQKVQMLITAIVLLMLVGSIMRCQLREADAPQKENVEAAEETSRQVPEQGPAPEMKPAEPADSILTMIERRYFEALTKIADGGKVYATDADGKRSPKAFTRFEDYRQFIADNPQYPKNYYSYDADGNSTNVNFKTND